MHNDKWGRVPYIVSSLEHLRVCVSAVKWTSLQVEAWSYKAVFSGFVTDLDLPSGWKEKLLGELHFS